jgi:hypothetical protein
VLLPALGQPLGHALASADLHFNLGEFAARALEEKLVGWVANACEEVDEQRDCNHQNRGPVAWRTTSIGTRSLPKQKCRQMGRHTNGFAHRSVVSFSALDSLSEVELFSRCEYAHEIERNCELETSPMFF